MKRNTTKKNGEVALKIDISKALRRDELELFELDYAEDGIFDEVGGCDYALCYYSAVLCSC